MSDWARTRRVRCRIVPSVDDPVDGDLHLQPLGAPDHPVETPLEMLNRAGLFFAVTVDDDVRLVAKSAVRVVELDPDEVPDHPLAEHVAVEVCMDDGGAYRGRIDIELPAPARRPLDFLNQPEPFFALEGEDRSWCLNRRRVVWVRPLD